mmetsp:Transcript_3002/g.12318  ORF Transcript_3002/g.12318 Transcript_3002/m.12318 type:complete len:108 (+) Transcript_3002:1104-1427(+)
MARDCSGRLRLPPRSPRAVASRPDGSCPARAGHVGARGGERGRAVLLSGEAPGAGLARAPPAPPCRGEARGSLPTPRLDMTALFVTATVVTPSLGLCLRALARPLLN